MKTAKVTTLMEALKCLELTNFSCQTMLELEEALSRFGLDVTLPRPGQKLRHREAVAYGTESVPGAWTKIVREKYTRRDHIPQEQYDPEKHDADSAYDEEYERS